MSAPAGVAQRSHKTARHLLSGGWKVKAACRKEEIAPSIFYPEDDQEVRGKSNTKRGKAGKQRLREAETRAKLICRECPVRAECLEYALAHGEQGIWGGMSEDERADILRHRAVNR